MYCIIHALSIQLYSRFLCVVSVLVSHTTEPYSGWNVQLYHNNVYGLWVNRSSFNGSWVILYHSITHASMGNGLWVMVYHSWCNVHGSSLMIQSFIIEIRSFDWLKTKFVSQPVFRNVSKIQKDCFSQYITEI